MKKISKVVVAVMLSLLTANVYGAPKKAKAAGAEKPKDYDFVFQLLNMSSHNMEVWPEITTREAVPKTYERRTVASGECATYYFKSDDIDKDIENYQKESGTEINKEKGAWFIFGVKDLETEAERWTTGVGLNFIKNNNEVIALYDDFKSNIVYNSPLLKKTGSKADCNYTITNNTDKAVYVSNVISSKGRRLKGISEQTLVKPKEKVTLQWNKNDFTKDYPNCVLGVKIMNQYDTGSQEGWFAEFYDLKKDVTFAINETPESPKTITKLLQELATEAAKHASKEAAKPIEEAVITAKNTLNIKNREIDLHRYVGSSNDEKNYSFKITNNTNYLLVFRNWLYDKRIKDASVNDSPNNDDFELSPGSTVTMTFDVDKLVNDYDSQYSFCAQYILIETNSAGEKVSLVENGYSNNWYFDISKNMAGKKTIVTASYENEELHTDFYTTFTESKEITGVWKEATWGSAGDKYFTVGENGRKVIFSDKGKEKTDTLASFRMYTKYFEEKVCGFEAELKIISGENLLNPSFGFTFNEDIDKNTGYMLTISNGSFYLSEKGPDRWYYQLDDGKGHKFTNDLHNKNGVVEKITVKRAGNNINIYFNDKLQWVIQDAKYLSGYTRIVCGQNRKPGEDTEAEFEYLKFQFEK